MQASRVYQGYTITITAVDNNGTTELLIQVVTPTGIVVRSGQVASNQLVPALRFTRSFVDDLVTRRVTVQATLDNLENL